MDKYQETLRAIRPYLDKLKHLGKKESIEIDSIQEHINLALEKEDDVLSTDLSQLRRMNLISIISTGLILLLLLICCILLLFTEKRDIAFVSALFAIIIKAVNFFVFKRIDKLRKSIKDGLPGLRYLYSMSVMIDSCKNIVKPENRDAVHAKLIADLNKKMQD